MRRTLLVTTALLSAACSPKSDEDMFVEGLEKIAAKGDVARAAEVYDLEVRQRAEIVAQLIAARSDAEPALAQQLLPTVGDPAALAQERAGAVRELLGGMLGDELKAGGCSWKPALPSDAKALAMPDTRHGMPVPLHNAVVDLDNEVGHMEIGEIACSSGHLYPVAIVKRREDASPWRLLRVGLPPRTVP